MIAINNSDYKLMALSISAGLLLLATLYYAWKNFKLLFESVSGYTWFFSDDIPKAPADITKDKISLTIKLPQEITVANKTLYPIVVHGNLAVGFLFFYFLKVQYKYGLMATDSSFEEEHEWTFYLLNKSGKRKTVLNPESTIRENGIKENGVIEAVRTVKAKKFLEYAG